MQMSAGDNWQGKMVGRYRLIQLLGRGGMGEVWLAEDSQLRRQVAAKLLPAVLASDRSYLQNFEREARAAAALEHPHILPVHDFGDQRIAEDEVVTYLIMPHITGGSLRERIQDVTESTHRRLSSNDALHYLRQAAQAIDYAHSRNVIHRDIKPANMLLQQNWLFLADFGLAKLITSTTLRSRTHAGSGTPEYMAPEQARGKAEFASDRYSFAVVAYLLFTGHVPFSGDTYYSVLIKHLTEEPPAPRRFNPSLPQTVEQALLQGLAKQPGDRPTSCMALVTALEHGWQMAPIERVDPDATMLAPWRVRREDNLPPASTDNSPMVTPVLQQPQASQPPGMPVSYYGNGQSLAEQDIQPVPTYYGTPVSQSQVPASIEAPGGASLPVTGEEHGKVSRRTFLVGGAGAALVAVAGSGIALYAFSHRGPTLVHTPTTIPGHTVSQPHPTPGPQKLVKGTPILSLTGHSDSVENVAWDPSGRYLATGGYDSNMMLWDIGSYLQRSTTGVQSISKPLHKWALSNKVLSNALCWSPDGQTIGVAIGDSEIRLFDASSNADTPHVYQAPTSANAPLYAFLSWSPRANTFAAANTPLGKIAVQVDLWQKSNATAPAKTLSYIVTDHVVPLPLSELHTYTTPPFVTVGFVDATSWSAGGTLIAGHTNFNFVIIWDAATGAVKQVLRMRQGSPATLIAKDALAWSPVDPHLLVVSDIDVARLWDIEQNKVLLTLKVNGPYPSLTGLTWAPNGKYVAGTYARSRQIDIWDVQMTGPSAAQSAVRTPILSFPGNNEPGHSATAFDIAWSPDGRYLATASGDNTVLIWKVDAA
jgi:serine/threonine protein kinase/WD40 repeat protein